LLRVSRSLVAGAVTVLALSGCAIQQDSTEIRNESSVEQSDTAPQNPDPETDTETDTEQYAEPEIEVVDCSQVIQSGIEKSINAQTASFAVGDFELAYSYASTSFQASVSLERFIGIIQGSYGPLISSSQLSFDNCLFYPNAELATIDVRFTEAGSEVYALRYVTVETELGWRVDGASALASIGSGT